MSRVKAIISYDGSAYHGFQKQTSTTKTITYQIENALQSLHIQSAIVGSGRTDAGVHATGQVIHFELPDYWDDLQKLKLNLNRKLYDIQCKHITPVEDTFHARFSAKRRLYRYIFKTSKPSVFEQKYISYYEPFNVLALQDALSSFMGKHDFDYFRKSGTHTHTSTREVYKAFYIQRGPYHFIYFEANGFLRSQVRMMVESAMLVAKNELSKEQLLAQLACQQKSTTKLAPSEGLYLAKVLY